MHKKKKKFQKYYIKIKTCAIFFAFSLCSRFQKYYIKIKTENLPEIHFYFLVISKILY